MIQADFLKQLDRFSLALKKKVHSAYAGNRASPVAGTGLLFRDYREYVSGDDFRKIDWRIYARTDKYYIRRYEEERNLTLHIIIDASASMDFGESITKFDYACMLALGFGHIALRNNEKFEFTTFAEKLRTIKARKGVNQLISIVDALNGITPKGESKFERSLASYKQLITSKSLIIVISDFLFNIDELREVLHRYKKSELFLIQVLDPVELNFDLDGDYNLVDSESGVSLKTLISNRLRGTYRKGLDKHNFDIRDFCERIGAKFYTARTDTDIFDSFYEILTQKS